MYDFLVNIRRYRIKTEYGGWNWFSFGDLSFSTYAKFFEKLTVLTPWVRNVSFSENFVYLVIEWFLTGIANKNIFQVEYNHRAFIKSFGNTTQLTFTCLKSTIETLEKGVKYVIAVKFT